MSSGIWYGGPVVYSDSMLDQVDLDNISDEDKVLIMESGVPGSGNLFCRDKNVQREALMVFIKGYFGG